MLNRPDFRSLDSLEPFDDIEDMIKDLQKDMKTVLKKCLTAGFFLQLTWSET